MYKISTLHYISQGKNSEEQEKNIYTALQNGINWVQLRWKNATKEEILHLALRIKKHCKKHNATFIINDLVDIAQQVDADGVHLGLKDMSISEAKKILGKNKIYGGTANTITDVIQRIDEGCNYIGLGPYKFTSTKENLSPILGIEGYKHIIQQLKTQEKNIPIIAIGGIKPEDIFPLKKIGLYGVALSQYITKFPQEIKKIQNIL